MTEFRRIFRFRFEKSYPTRRREPYPDRVVHLIMERRYGRRRLKRGYDPDFDQLQVLARLLAPDRDAVVSQLGYNRVSFVPGRDELGPYKAKKLIDLAYKFTLPFKNQRRQV